MPHAHTDSRHRFLLAFALLMASACQATAIPSPELVIGSTTAIGQLLALGGAGFLGVFGLKGRAGAKISWLGRAVLLCTLALALIFAALWWQLRAAERARLEATLLRPAQFEGNPLKDPTLFELSYQDQTASPYGLTTTEAAAMLARDELTLLDIRETAEHEMGALPGAAHLRFPDLLADPTKAAQDGRPVVFFCHNGNRSAEACITLAKAGIDCRFIIGGIEKWLMEGRSYSDPNIRKLEDLRAIPDYPNRRRLLSTEAFTESLSRDPLIIDTRYPLDFAAAHLPGAINMPIRALTSDVLAKEIALLPAGRPVVLPCYDRRSCFMAEVLGLSLHRAGFEILGRYTLPWEYFPPKEISPHLAAFLATQQGVFGTAKSWVAALIANGFNTIGVALTLLATALFTRLLILPVSLKAERDQRITQQTADERKALDARFGEEPALKYRAMRAYYQKHKLTPMRNALVLLYLPLLALGLAGIETASASSEAGLTPWHLVFTLASGGCAYLYLKQSFGGPRA